MRCVMKDGWKVLHFQNSCIKQVDDEKRRLLFEVPGTPYRLRVWVKMSLVKFETRAGNGFYKKLIYKDDFIFHGKELIGKYLIDATITGRSLAEYCQHMNRHILETISTREAAERDRAKKYDQQKWRY